MDLEPYLQRIRTAFPGLQFKAVTIPKQGLDHLVLFLDDRWVFRFPKDPQYSALLPHEMRLLNELHRHISLPIPHYRYIAKDFTFGGYERIQGEQMWPSLFAALPDAIQQTIACQLGQFLAEFHAFPVRRAAEEFAVPTTDPLEELHTLKAQYREHAQPEIPPEEQWYCDQLFAELDACMKPGYQLTLTHTDLNGEHILLTPEHDRLAGIIDFGDKRIYDPAIDFAGLWDYGYPLVRKVYELYGAGKDDSFLQRSLLHYRSMTLTALITEIRRPYWHDYQRARAQFKRSMFASLE